MKTEEKKAAVQGTAKNNQVVRTANRPNLTGKEAKADEKANDQKPAEATEAKAAQTADTPAVPTLAVGDQPADAKAGQEVKAGPAQQEAKAGEVKAEQPKAEEAQAEQPKGEIRYIKPVQNLEQTLKTVGNLHRLTIQRIALIARIKTLEDFEVKLVEENDQLENNPYQGCKLTIKDDKGREFTTNTPNLIRMVSQYIFDACHEKLADIEANIVFPNA